MGVDDIEDSRGLLSSSWSEKRTAESAPRSRNGNWNLYSVALISLLVGTVLGAFLNSIPQAAPLEDEAVPKEAVSDTANAFAKKVFVTFEKNGTFADYIGPESDEEWEKLLPLGQGFVQIDDDGNPIPHGEGKAKDLSQTKVVSVYHQLHCLNMLRKSLFASVDDPESATYLILQFSYQWNSCFDYLRQALMCNADITLEELEKSQNEDGEVRTLPSVDGWGTTHVCRSWENVFEWAERYRATDDDDGID